MPDPPPVTPNTFLASLLDLDFKIPDFKIPETKATSNPNSNQFGAGNSISGGGPPIAKNPSMNHTRTYSNLSTVSSMTPSIPIFTEPPITPNSFMRELEDIEYQASFSQHSRNQSWSGANHKVQVPRPISAPMYNQDGVLFEEPFLQESTINQPFEIIHAPQPLTESELQALSQFEQFWKNTLVDTTNVGMTFENNHVMPRKKANGGSLRRGASKRLKIQTNLSKIEPIESLTSFLENMNVIPDEFTGEQRDNGKNLNIQKSVPLSMESDTTLSTQPRESISSQDTREDRKAKPKKSFTSDTARQAYLKRQRESDRQRRQKYKERKESLEKRISVLKDVNERLKVELLEYNSRIEKLSG